MKFAHEFQAAMAKEGFPAHWVESAVPYGQLKKVIKKVARELSSLGLDSETLAQLIPDPGQENTSTRRGSGVAFQYDFDSSEKDFHPKLTLFIQVEDGLAVDAALSHGTREYLERLASNNRGSRNASSDSAWEIDESNGNSKLNQESWQKPQPDAVVQRVEVPLTFDAEFFEILQGDVTHLDTLQADEQKALNDEISALSKEVTIVSKPSKHGKSDLYRWRELFDIYLQASIFFSTHEVDHGSRNSTVALRQLQWFQSEVTKRKLAVSFKLPASRQALNRFVNINATLLQNLRFQEFNQRAIGKILKKFDKRTKLGATRTFPKLIQSDAIMSETMAKAVCSQMMQDLIKIVPQLDDYLCPVCFSVSWRPIRMKCKHVFCIRCTIVMQRQRKNFCPLCRDNVIMEADEDNIDGELTTFLKKYFPKEVREKQIEHETADGIEKFGVLYKHPSESKCSMM